MRRRLRKDVEEVKEVVKEWVRWRRKCKKKEVVEFYKYTNTHTCM